MADPAKNFRMDVRVRVFDGDTLAYGKGVNQLLMLCGKHRSLHKAAEEMQMSYRKALQIVQRAEASLGQPLLIRTIGGEAGGGSEPTPFCERLVEGFSRIEARAARQVEKEMQALFE